MHILRILLGFAICGSFIIGSMGDELVVFFNLPSILLVIGVLIGGAIWSFPLNKSVELIGNYLMNSDMTEQQALEGHNFFNRLANLALGAGMTGSMVGLVLMLANLDDPTTIGPAMAVALLCPLYGCVLGELFFRSMASGCLSSGDALGHRYNRGSSPLYIHVVTLLLVLGAFSVMLLSFSSFE